MDDLPLVQPIELAYRSSAAVHGLMLSKIEKQELVKCVRSGDKGARGQFVLTFMRYCEDLAWKYSQMYKGCSTRIEYVDLAQLGLLTIMEIMDQALEKHEDPFPYIVVAVRREIIEYCVWHGNLIRIPETRDKNGSAAHKPYTIESIYAKRPGEEECLADILPESEEQEIQEHPLLLEAVERLQGRYREVIQRYYGFNGYAPESLPQISLAISGKKDKSCIASSYRSLALKKLKKLLTSVSLEESMKARIG